MGARVSTRPSSTRLVTRARSFSWLTVPKKSVRSASTIHSFGGSWRASTFSHSASLRFRGFRLGALGEPAWRLAPVLPRRTRRAGRQAAVPILRGDVRAPFSPAHDESGVLSLARRLRRSHDDLGPAGPPRPSGAPHRSLGRELEARPPPPGGPYTKTRASEICSPVGPLCNARDGSLLRLILSMH